MATPSPTDWTDDRCTELEEMELLVREVRSINHGSSVIQRLILCQQIAEKLSKSDLGNGGLEHFLGFLRSLAIKDRFPKATN